MNSYNHFYESSGLFHGALTCAMGTRLDALMVQPDEKISSQCWLEIKNEISRLSGLFNKFDGKSELYAINKRAGISPQPVSNELWTILTDCKRYHTMTSGYFDISLKNLNKVLLNQKGRTVFFEDMEIQLDMGAYGKGYALEKIRAILQSWNISCALINFGNSSVLALGSHPHGDTWPIGIQDPYNPEKTVATVELSNMTLSTSGNMPTHTKHILDPFTGIYTEDRRIISVKAANAVDAEVLSTTLMIAPPVKVKDIISNFTLEEYLTFEL